MENSSPSIAKNQSRKRKRKEKPTSENDTKRPRVQESEDATEKSQNGAFTNVQATQSSETVTMNGTGAERTKKKRRRKRKRASGAERREDRVQEESDEGLRAEVRPSPMEDTQNEMDDAVHQTPKKRDVATGKASRKRKKLRNQSAPTSQANEALKVSSHGPNELSWTISSQTCGRFADLDPLFVRNDHNQEFLISATALEIQLLSLDTSLVVRRYSSPGGSLIRCFSVDPKDRSLIHVAYSNGSVEVWNWTSGEIAHDKAWRATGDITRMTSSQPQAGKSGLFYVSNHGQYSAIYSGDGLLHKSSRSLLSIQALGEADYLVAHGSSTLLLGWSGSSKTSADFVWLEFPLHSQVTCCGARLVPASKPDKNAPLQMPGLSVAVGVERGEILYFDDLSSLFLTKYQPRLPNPRVLHWHRNGNGVAAVKFSTDGNYLISGSTETVLVLWQLSTGKTNFLPHLTSAIQQIVVNKQGDRYALKMGDNSIMVLSTSELKPVANFAGLQITSKISPSLISKSVVLHPKIPNRLLLTVPATLPRSTKEAVTRPFLQTFDISASRHVKRQALTRNNVTDFNTGPDARPIIQPDVALLAVSPDGIWMATVDDWVPPRDDLAHLVSEKELIKQEQEKRRETYLKIWQWDNRDSLWTLTTRADAAHAHSDEDNVGAGKILDLKSHPITNSFATVGEDHIVKIWRPKPRKRHGVVLTSEDGSDLIEWTCRHTVKLPHDFEEADSVVELAEHRPPESANLAFSEDGSLLAVSFAGADSMVRPMYFIDTLTGQIDSVKTGYSDHKIVSIDFLERYFIVVAKSAIYVWDLIDDAMVNKIEFGARQKQHYRSSPLLAVNHIDGTFALATQTETDRFSVQVYKPQSVTSLHHHRLETGLCAILPNMKARGYTLVFADAVIRTLTPTGMTHLSNPVEIGRPRPAINDDDASLTGEEAILDLPSGHLEGSARPTLANTEDDRAVVRPEQLASIFDAGPSFAMPPVRDMFQAVVKMFGRQPTLAR